MVFLDDDDVLEIMGAINNEGETYENLNSDNESMDELGEFEIT